MFEVRFWGATLDSILVASYSSSVRLWLLFKSLFVLKRLMTIIAMKVMKLSKQLALFLFPKACSYKAIMTLFFP